MSRHEQAFRFLNKPSNGLPIVNLGQLAFFLLFAVLLTALSATQVEVYAQPKPEQAKTEKAAKKAAKKDKASKKSSKKSKKRPMTTANKPQLEVQPNANAPQPDPHSAARPSEARVSNLDLKLNVDFDAKQLQGRAVLLVKLDNFDKAAHSQTPRVLSLDTRQLEISSVVDGEGKVLKFALENEDPNKPWMGQALHIQLPAEIEPNGNDGNIGTTTVQVNYITSPSAAALQWLSPAQTAGKVYPFLFSQSQAILARTWVPIQDGPGMRFTYTAAVDVPQGLFAVMSATNTQGMAPDGHYEFQMTEPIPAYLLAIAVGEMQFVSLGERTGVYAEPVTIEAAAKEFNDTEQMLIAAEALYGPYAWGRYDLLVLPPSFPFGGMENPRVTFATPTILAGDGSLTSLVAHELAHSWSGNLVTNATWNDFWLNEGFTVYFERRIMEAIRGESFAQMMTVLGYTDVMHTIKDLGETSPATKLKLDLGGQDPDDGMNDIAYEKGYFLLRSIEERVGREAFDSFLKDYFASNAFGSMDTERFLDYIKENLLNKFDNAAEELQLEQWIYQPGMPDWVKEPTSDRFTAVEADAAGFMNKGELPKGAKSYVTFEWMRFIQSCQGMNAAQMAKLDGAYELTKSGNAEILCLWLEAAIAAEYKPAMPALEQFLTTIGRRKFLLPLYKGLLAKEQKEEARRIYTLARPNYHSVAVSTFDEMLGKPNE